MPWEQENELEQAIDRNPLTWYVLFKLNNPAIPYIMYEIALSLSNVRC